MVSGLNTSLIYLYSMRTTSGTSLLSVPICEWQHWKYDRDAGYPRELILDWSH